MHVFLAFMFVHYMYACLLCYCAGAGNELLRFEPRSSVELCSLFRNTTCISLRQGWMETCCVDQAGLEPWD